MPLPPYKARTAYPPCRNRPAFRTRFRAALAALLQALPGKTLGALLLEKRCAFCAGPIVRQPGQICQPDQIDQIKQTGQIEQIGPAAPGKANRPDAASASNICASCLGQLPRRSAGFCLRCGEFTADSEMLGGVCGNCLRLPPPWEEIFFHGAYQHRLRELILQLKFAEGLHIAEGLGSLLAAHPRLAEHTGPEAGKRSPARYACVIPVPLHTARLRERGFNQAALLAAPLAKALGVKLDLASLKRSVPTGHQTGLTREERRRNVARAFSCGANLTGRRILLVDDVLTTGATLAAAAQTLLKAGASGVDVAVVARTPARNMTGWA